MTLKQKKKAEIEKNNLLKTGGGKPVTVIVKEQKSK